MDNSGSHKNKEIKTYIKETDNYLLYSVPYKYKTNAIESFLVSLNIILLLKIQHSYTMN